jgi:hypothetical protein
MATWTYGAWRRQSGSSAQRSMLLLHIEEVQDKLSGFSLQSSGASSAQRFPLIDYLKTLNSELDRLDSDLNSGDTTFIQGKPQLES